MPSLPLPTRVLASSLLVVAVHACLLLALLAPAPARLAPPPVLDVALLMAPGPAAPSGAPAAPASPRRTVAPAASAPALLAPAAVHLAQAPTPVARMPATPAMDLPSAVPDASLPPRRDDVSGAAPTAASSPAAGVTSDGGAASSAGTAAASGAASGQGGTAAITPPQLDPGNPSNPRPVYPAASRRLGESGVVALRLRVMPDGHVAEVQLLRSSGYDRLDQAALQVARRWTLRPARQGGEAVAAWLPYSIKFELER